MIFKGLLQRKAPPEQRLYEAIVAAARRPLPYEAWAVPDTLDGRFDMVALHLFLVLDRLKGSEDAARQGLVDTFFLDMDRSLREIGVGDLSVGKKVRKMAESFYGRVAAYEKALGEGRASFAAAIARNVYPDGAPEGMAERLAAFAETCRGHLAAQESMRIIAGEISFPEPSP